QKTALRLGVAPDAVRAEFKKFSRTKTHVADQSEETIEGNEQGQPPSSHEFWLIKLLLVHDELAEWAVRHFDPAWVQHPLVKQITAQRLIAHREQRWSSLAAFLDECESQELQTLITSAAADERPIPNPGQQLQDVTTRLRNQFFDRSIAALMHRTNQPE